MYNIIFISSSRFCFRNFVTSWISAIFPIHKYVFTFFFSFMTESIRLYPYLAKSINYFFFYSSYPNKELNCFLRT